MSIEMKIRSFITFGLLLVGGLATSQAIWAQACSSYSNSSADLTRLIEELHQAAKENDRKRFDRTAEPLFFAGHEAWFKEVFGERLGGYASRMYGARAAQFANGMYEAFQRLELQGLTEPQVQLVDEPCGRLVLTVESPVLFARKKRAPLYSVRYKRNRKFITIGLFVFADEGFRYVGKVDLGPVNDVADLNLLKVEQNAQVRKLLNRVQPGYPEAARRARLQGRVRLQAIVDAQGAVQALRLISGHCWLAQAAIEAVRQWRYEPTFVNGSPVEVTTTIEVIFTLSS